MNKIPFSLAVLGMLCGAALAGESVSVHSAAGPTEPTDPNPASATGSDQLAEVVVTAQKHAERAVDIPISVSVLTGVELDSSNAMGLSEQLGRTPALATTTASQSGGTVITLRGVAPPYALFNGQSTVGYYLDSVPFGLVKSAIAPDLDPYDLQRVEVLRGPQGVFYGADSLNGVVRVLTQDPDPEEYDFKSRVTGSYTQGAANGNYRGDAALNVPIVDGTFAGRLVVGYNHLAGWIDRPNASHTNDAAFSTVRLKLAAQPTPALSVGMMYWRSRDNYGDLSQGYTDNQNSYLIDEPIDNGFDASNLKIAYQFSGFTISSVTSYLDYTSNSILDLGPVIFGTPDAPLFTGLNSRVLSEEFNISSSGTGPWQWSGGGIFRRGKDYQTQTLPVVLSAPLYWTDESKSSAIFGQLTRKLFDDRFEVSAGARYFHDETHHVTGPGLYESAPLEGRFNNVSPRVAFTWHPAKDFTTYASYSTGFRSGFGQGPLTVLSAPNLPPVQPDKLYNYEVGAKADLFDGRASFDTALYYIVWKDVQQSVNVLFNGAGVSADVNGASASGPGVDFALTLRPAAGLSVSASFGWNQLTMDQAVVSGGILYSNKGDRLVSSPEYTAGFNIAYSAPLGGSGYLVRFDASGNYISNYYADSAGGVPAGGQLQVTEGESYLTGRASIGIAAPRHWSASIYTENLNNYSGSFTPNNQSAPNAAWHLPDALLLRVRPRTTGLEFDYRFAD